MESNGKKEERGYFGRTSLELRGFVRDLVTADCAVTTGRGKKGQHPQRMVLSQWLRWTFVRLYMVAGRGVDSISGGGLARRMTRVQALDES